MFNQQNVRKIPFKGLPTSTKFNFLYQNGWHMEVHHNKEGNNTSLAIWSRKNWPRKLASSKYCILVNSGMWLM